MTKKIQRRGVPRHTQSPGQPTEKQIAISAHRANTKLLIERRKAATRFARARAEFSRRYVGQRSWPNNPSQLTVEQLDEIRTHPQHVDPEACPQSDRLFVLSSSWAA